MMLSAAAAALLFGLAVLAGLAGAYNVMRALQTREQLITRAEDLGADPEVLSDPLRRKSFLVRWTDRYDRSPKAVPEREQLRRANLPWKPSDYRVIRIGLGIGLTYTCAMILKLALLPSVLLGLVAYFVVPRIFFATRREAYVKAFNDQLIEITQLMSNALRAGMSIQQAIGEVVARVPEPAHGEFRQAQHELLLGDNLAMALNGLRERVRSRDLDVVVNAIVVQHQAGGNLARVLRSMSNILSERHRLASEIQSLTAEARYSALIVMVMPAAILLMLRGTPVGEALFTTTIGWILLAIFGAAQVGIYMLIQRLARIEA